MAERIEKVVVSNDMHKAAMASADAIVAPIEAKLTDIETMLAKMASQPMQGVPASTRSIEALQ